MWFDVVEKIINSKTFIIAFHDGQDSSRKQLEQLLKELKVSNIHNAKMVSFKSTVGAKIAQTYDLPRHTNVIIVREDKRVAWMWSGLQLPLFSDVVCRFNQVG